MIALAYMDLKDVRHLGAAPIGASSSAPDAARSGERGRSRRGESLIRCRCAVLEGTETPHIRRGAGVFTESRAQNSGSTIHSSGKSFASPASYGSLREEM